MKKILYYLPSLSALALIFFAPHALAQGFQALAPIPGLTDTGTTAIVLGPGNNFGTFFNNLYKFCVGFAAAAAVVEIIWGGLEIASPDSVVKNKLGKERIQNALFGLLLVLSPVIVFSIINPKILDLSVNFDAVNLYVPPQTYTAPQTTPATPPATDTAIREAAGIQTFTPFSIPDSLTLVQIRALLTTKQAECAQLSNGLGFINPPTPQSNAFTCQTCPTGTTLQLQNARDAVTPLGVCNLN